MRLSKGRGMAMAAVAILAMSACSRVPDGVIDQERMAALMADVRVADAVVSVNTSDYRNPVDKLALKQAVLDRHGVTQAQFDSSLMWYGHNIGLYQDVTERSIELLEERMARLGSEATAAAMSIAGDSVDIWQTARLYTFTSKSPTRTLTFNLKPDRNWESGDVYTWRARLVVPPANARWGVTAEYDDGAVEIVSNNMSTSTPGKREITIFTDSTRRAVSVSGWMELTPGGDGPVVVDSVELVRRRRYKPEYQQFQRLIIPRSHGSSASDTVAGN